MLIHAGSGGVGTIAIQLAKHLGAICPALTVSLVIGCLYSFFGAAPAILMIGMGLSPVGLSIFFAATVLVVRRRNADRAAGAPLARAAAYAWIVLAVTSVATVVFYLSPAGTGASRAAHRRRW